MTVDRGTTEPRAAARTLDAWLDVTRELGVVFADRAGALDDHDTFAAENFADLRRHGFLSAGVPVELGGGGLSHADLGAVLRELARHCGSTALALAMHQHLVAANVYRFRRQQPGEALLRRVAEGHLVLVSTGGRDWLSSNGDATREEGGFRVSARKAFASACPVGDLLVTSAPFVDPHDGPVVLHFAVPLNAPGVRLEEDWHTLGMRGTGSHTVVLENVFVPDGAVSVRRPRGEWHPMWSVVLGVAMPLIMAVYVGVAEAAADLARQHARQRPHEPQMPYLLGEMHNELTTARLALDSMLTLANGYEFEPTLEFADAILVRKTLCAGAVVATAEKSLEVVGGAGFYRSFGLERLLRDVHGAPFHPLPEKAQHLFTGRLALGLTPVP